MARKYWIANHPSATVTAAQAQYYSGVTAGTLTASKAIVVDSSKYIDTLNIGTTNTGAHGIVMFDSPTTAILKITSDTGVAIVSTSVACSADVATSKVSGYVKVTVASNTGGDVTRYLWLYSAKPS